MLRLADAQKQTNSRIARLGRDGPCSSHFDSMHSRHLQAHRFCDSYTPSACCNNENKLSSVLALIPSASLQPKHALQNSSYSYYKFRSLVLAEADDRTHAVLTQMLGDKRVMTVKYTGQLKLEHLDKTHGSNIKYSVVGFYVCQQRRRKRS